MKLSVKSCNLRLILHDHYWRSLQDLLALGPSNKPWFSNDIYPDGDFPNGDKSPDSARYLKFNDKLQEETHLIRHVTTIWAWWNLFPSVTERVKAGWLVWLLHFMSSNSYELEVHSPSLSWGKKGHITSGWYHADLCWECPIWWGNWLFQEKPVWRLIFSKFKDFSIWTCQSNMPGSFWWVINIITWYKT